ncbi:hypothetical protein RFI_04360 [Reticulomyxa filosa]|uniref:Uncharacterized protein n=1 Tax=Reticulomyxa filosa TaxID=46433 RepID=X6P3H3_RETFI|nr:hypothetical protein RFI_04360 [Reticulomyxa filosa]|eukprot:ETO32756.1 hypothetical protein RFI_04360 [Reticulomyxa filosa]
MPTNDISAMPAEEVEIQYCLASKEDAKKWHNQNHAGKNDNFADEDHFRWKVFQTYSIDELHSVSKHVQNKFSKKVAKWQEVLRTDNISASNTNSLKTNEIPDKPSKNEDKHKKAENEKKQSKEKGKENENGEGSDDDGYDYGYDYDHDHDRDDHEEKVDTYDNANKQLTDSNIFFYCIINYLYFQQMYCIRSRAKNKFGWGPFGNCVFASTLNIEQNHVKWDRRVARAKQLPVRIDKHGINCEWKNNKYATIPCNFIISKKNYRKFAWECVVHDIPVGGICLGFIILPKDKRKSLENWKGFSTWCGNPLGQSSSFYFGGNSSAMKYDSGSSSNANFLPLPSKGDKFRFILYWKEKKVDMLHNGQFKLSFTGMKGGAIVPAVSNNGGGGGRVSIKFVSGHSNVLQKSRPEKKRCTIQ